MSGWQPSFRMGKSAIIVDSRFRNDTPKEGMED